MKVTIVSETIKIEYSDDLTLEERALDTQLEKVYNLESSVRIIDSLGSVAKMLSTPQNLSTDGTVQE